MAILLCIYHCNYHTFIFPETIQILVSHILFLFPYTGICFFQVSLGWKFVRVVFPENTFWLIRERLLWKAFDWTKPRALSLCIQIGDGMQWCIFSILGKLWSPQYVLPFSYVMCDRILCKFVDIVNGKCQQIPNKVS